MRITIKRKNIMLNGERHELNIGIILGFHFPCLSLVMPDRTINYGFVESVLELMIINSRLEQKLEDYS